MSTAGTLFGETVGGGFAKLLTSAVVSNGAALVALNLPSTYDAFLIDIESLYFSAEAALVLRLSSDGGASWPTATYYWSMSTVFSNNSNLWNPYGSNTLGDPHPTWIGWSHGVTAGHPLSGRVRVFAVPNLSTVLFRYCSPQPTLYTAANVGGGWLATSFAVPNAIAFIPSSGTFTGGNIRLYGMRKGT